MSWFKALAAIAIAALGAAVVLGFPGLSHNVEADLAPSALKSDRLVKSERVERKSERVDRPAVKGCSDNTWSYYDLKCQKTRTRIVNGVRTTRIVPREPEPLD
jgi:hypothetical protein